MVAYCSKGVDNQPNVWYNQPNFLKGFNTFKTSNILSIEHENTATQVEWEASPVAPSQREAK